MTKKKVPLADVSDDPRTDDELVDFAEENLAELQAAADGQPEQTIEIDMDLIGVDAGATGQYELVPPPVGYGPRDRTVRIGEVNLEHVDTDQYGRWLYRAQDF